MLSVSETLLLVTFFIVWEKNSHSSRSSSSSRSSLVFFVFRLHIMHYRAWILLPQCTLTPSTHPVDDSIAHWTHGDNRTITLWQKKKKKKLKNPNWSHFTISNPHNDSVQWPCSSLSASLMQAVSDRLQSTSVSARYP